MKKVGISAFETEEFRTLAADLVLGGFKLERGGFTLDTPLVWPYPWIKNSFVPAFAKEFASPERIGMLSRRTQESLATDGVGMGHVFGPFYALWKETRTKDIYYSSRSTLTVDSIMFGVRQRPEDNGPEKMVYFVSDPLSGCAYESEVFDTSGVDGASIVANMVRSAEEYAAKADLDDVVTALPKLAAPHFPIYPVILGPQDMGRESGGRELFGIFSNIIIRALPVCRGSRFGNGIKEDEDKQFIRQRYRKEQLEKFGYPEMRVNGHIERIILIPAGVRVIDEEAMELNINHLSGDHLQIDPSNLKFKDKNNGVGVYEYVDKYGNGVSIEVADPWWDIGRKKKVFSVIVIPNITLTEAGASELAPLNIDLTPIGLGEYKNVFRTSPFPKVDELDTGTAIYSSCYYEGDYLSEFDDFSKIHAQAGITMAEAMFNERNIVQKLVLLKMDGGYIQPHIKNTIFLNAFGEDDWGTPLHETIHLIHHKFALHEHPSIKEAVKGYIEGNVPPVFCKMIDEGTCGYCTGENIEHVERWLTPSEFISVLCESVMSDGLEKKFAGLSGEEQTRYIDEMKTLMEVIAEKVPNGHELPMYQRLVKTAQLLSPNI